MDRMIILFELNEVPWRVLDDFAAQRPHSALATVLRAGRAYTTVSEDAALSPWVTWPTVHRGVTDDQHTISDFGQDLSQINDAFPPLWALLVGHGISTGVCGSLHSYPLPTNVAQYAFYVPDVFASGSECHPHTIEAFQAFNLAMSRGSARNVGTTLSWPLALRFLRAAPALGVSPRTFADVARQLANERRHRWMRVRRRTFQVRLAFDIFMRQLQRTRPVFSTFFTNHVASAMHRYWAASYPTHFETFDYPVEWVTQYRDEIPWAMRQCDHMLRRLLQFVDAVPGRALWIATSMGQAATCATAAPTQVYLSDVDTFMHRLGFERGEWESRPAMLPRVILAVRPARAAALEGRLRTVQIADRGPLPWKRIGHDVFRIHPGTLQNVSDEYCVVDGRRLSFAETGFRNLTIEDSAGQSAYHVPEGALLVYDPATPRNGHSRTTISTTAVAPLILRELGVPCPAYMHTPTL